MKSPGTDNLIATAESLREQARYQQSIRVFRKALKDCEKAGEREDAYYCLRSLGDLYRMTGRFDLAGKKYTEAVHIARDMHSPDKAADARIGLGLSLRAQGMWQRAVHLIRSAIKRYRTMNDRYGLAFALWAEAGTLRIKGDVPGALKTFRQSYRLFQRLNDHQGIGYCLCGLGGASRIAGRTKASLKYYLAANRVFSDTHDIFGKAYSYCGIANAYRMLEDYRGAFASFAKATRLYRIIGDKVSYAYTLWGLGTAYKMTCRYQKARNEMMKAMQLFRETKDPRGIIYCRLGLAEIAFLSGDMTRADKFLVSALTAVAKLRFGVEGCHANTLKRIINSQRARISSSAQQRLRERLIKGAPLESCYQRLGLNLRFHSLPLNFP